MKNTEQIYFQFIDKFPDINNAINDLILYQKEWEWKDDDNFSVQEERKKLIIKMIEFVRNV